MFDMNFDKFTRKIYPRLDSGPPPLSTLFSVVSDHPKMENSRHTVVYSLARCKSAFHSVSGPRHTDWGGGVAGP
jgi:hypothetical protein